MSQLIKKQDSREIVIRQANALTTAAYSLTRNEKRLVYMAIHAIGRNEVQRSEHGDYPVEIVHDDYAKLFDCERKNLSRDIAKAAKDLNKKEVVFYVSDEDAEDGEKAEDGISWTTKRSHRPRRGVTVMAFNSRIIKIINEVDKEFTKILMIEAGNLTSPHSMRLYESIRQWAKRGQVTFSIAWMQERYELPPSYCKRMPDFRRRFLKPSIEEINQKTNLHIEAEEIPDKENKKRVKSILFTIKEKCPAPSLDVDDRDLTLEDAVRTYADINGSYKLPTTNEIENLKAHMATLVMEGFTFDSEFIMKIKEAELANSD